MIPFAVALVAMVLVGRHSDRTGERKWHVAVSSLVAALGLAARGRASGPTRRCWSLSLTICQMGQRSVQPTFWTLPPLFLEAPRRRRASRSSTRSGTSAASSGRGRWGRCAT